MEGVVFPYSYHMEENVLRFKNPEGGEGNNSSKSAYSNHLI